VRLSLISVGPPYRGGISDLSALLHAELIQKHEVQFINYRRQYPAFLFPGKTEYKVGSKAADLDSDRVIDSINPLTWWRAVKLIRRHESQWAVFRYWNPFFAPLIGFISGRLRKHGIKVALLVDNLVPHEESFIDSMMARLILDRADHVFTMSRSVTADVEAHRNTVATTTLFHPLYEIYRGGHSKEEARKVLGLADHPVILYFGLIRPYKGLDILIRALGLIHRELKEYTALIHGEAYEDAGKYEALIESEGVGANTRFKNAFVSDTDLPLLFAAADVLVLPYRTATQSGIVGIALQMDRPVIATQVGGLGEYIQHGETGYLVAPEDPQALGKAILTFFSGNDRERMVQNIRKTKSRYSTAHFCERLIGELQDG